MSTAVMQPERCENGVSGTFGNVRQPTYGYESTTNIHFPSNQEQTYNSASRGSYAYGTPDLMYHSDLNLTTQGSGAERNTDIIPDSDAHNLFYFNNGVIEDRVLNSMRCQTLFRKRDNMCVASSDSDSATDSPSSKDDPSGLVKGTKRIRLSPIAKNVNGQSGDNTAVQHQGIKNLRKPVAADVPAQVVKRIRVDSFGNSHCANNSGMMSVDVPEGDVLEADTKPVEFTYDPKDMRVVLYQGKELLPSPNRDPKTIPAHILYNLTTSIPGSTTTVPSSLNAIVPYNADISNERKRYAEQLYGSEKKSSQCKDKQEVEDDYMMFD
eukprot:CFRG7160T1